MTTNQREDHINSINALLIKYGATKDRWEMYHIGERKFDTRKNNFKMYSGKIKVKSEPLSKISLVWLESYLKRITGK